MQRQLVRAPPDRTGSPAPEPVLTRFVPPAPRAGLLPRAGLRSLLRRFSAAMADEIDHLEQLDPATAAR